MAERIGIERLRQLLGEGAQLLEILPFEVAVKVDAGHVGSPVEERTSVLTKKIPKATASASG